MSRWNRHLYPIDWPQLSQIVRERAGWVCSRCGRPHRTWVEALPDGRWRLLDGDWRSDQGHRAAPAPGGMGGRLSYTVLSAAHRDHREVNAGPKGLLCLCRRCHLLHDRPWHRQQRMITLRARWAIGDLFGSIGGPWPTRYPR